MGNTSDLIIVGAGVGGLSLGLLAARKGHKILIMDQRQGIEPIFKPEILQPRGLEHLEQLGVVEQLATREVYRCERYHFYRAWKGRLLTVNYGVLKHPYPYTLIAFPHLTQQALLEKLQIYEHVQVRWDMHLQGVVRHGDQVVGVTASHHGQEFEFRAPIVVGADGKSSRVRKALGIPCRIHHYPDAFVTLLVNRPAGFNRDARYYFGLRSILALFPASDTRLCLLFMIRAGSLPQWKAVGLNVLKETIVSIDPVVSDGLQEVTDWEQVSYFPCCRVKASSWVADGAVLLGDAVHAVFPHVAQGSTQAMEDAHALAQVLDTCFQQGDFRAQALAPYEQERHASVARLQQLADEYVWLWNTANPILAWLRDRIITNIGRNEHLMYETIANEAGLQVKPLTVWERMQAIAGM